MGRGTHFSSRRMQRAPVQVSSETMCTGTSRSIGFKPSPNGNSRRWQRGIRPTKPRDRWQPDMFNAFGNFFKDWLPRSQVTARLALTNEPRQPLLPIGFYEFLDLSVPPREMLLDPILPERSLSMLYAPRGVGKSWLGLSVGLAVASGTPLLRWSAPRKRRVLMLMARCHLSRCRNDSARYRLAVVRKFRTTALASETSPARRGGAADTPCRNKWSATRNVTARRCLGYGHRATATRRLQP